MTSLDSVISLITQECDRQDKLWGKQRHDDFVWLAIISEEVGEAAKAIMHNQFDGEAKGTLPTELIQIAAVAVQWLTAIGGHMSVNEPIDVTPQREPITMLQSALDALDKTAAREVHRMGELEPQQAAAVLNRISWLEKQLERRDAVIVDLADQLSRLMPANPFEEAE